MHKKSSILVEKLVKNKNLVFTDARNIGFIFYCGGIPLRSNLIDNFKYIGRARVACLAAT